MNNGNCMDLSQFVYAEVDKYSSRTIDQLPDYSQIYVPFFRLGPVLYLNSGQRLSITDLLCCRAALGLRPQQWRAREVAEMILGILGFGKSVIQTASAYRLVPGISQELRTDYYRLGEMITLAYWDFWNIYRAGKLMKSLIAIISASFLRKLKKRGFILFNEYTRQTSSFWYV